MTNTHNGGRFRKVVFTDPRHDVVLQQVFLETLRWMLAGLA